MQKIVTALKEKHPHINRVYVRAEFPDINDDYRKYLLENYEDTYFPQKIKNSGKAVYVERNYEMIDNSDFCVICYDENYIPRKRKSGTALAYGYALKKNRHIVNMFL